MNSFPSIFLIALFAITCLFGLFWLSKKWDLGWSKKWVTLVWLTKLLAGLLFYYIYTFTLGNGKLSQDAGAYVLEAKKLNAILTENSADYFQLLLNLKECDTLTAEYFKEFEESRFSRDNDPFGETRNHIRFLSLLYLVFFDNEFVALIFVFFLQIAGLLYLYKLLHDRKEISQYCIILFLLPSFLFWTSSPLKEAHVLIALNLIFVFFISPQRGKWTYTLLFLGLLLLFFTKSYLFFVLAFALLISFIIEGFLVKHQYLKFAFLTIVATLLFFVFQYKIIHSISSKQLDFQNIARGGAHLKKDSNYYVVPFKNLKYIQYLDKMKSNQVVLKKNIEAGLIVKNTKKISSFQPLVAYRDTFELAYSNVESNSRFELETIDNSWKKAFFLAPKAAFNTFLRPLPSFDKNGLRDWFLFFENCFYGILLLSVLFSWARIPLEYLRLFFFLLSFIIMISILVGWTTNVSIAINRYKIPMIYTLIVCKLLTLTFKKVNA